VVNYFRPILVTIFLKKNKLHLNRISTGENNQAIGQRGACNFFAQQEAANSAGQFKVVAHQQ